MKFRYIVNLEVKTYRDTEVKTLYREFDKYLDVISDEKSVNGISFFGSEVEITDEYSYRITEEKFKQKYLSEYKTFSKGDYSDSFIDIPCHELEEFEYLVIRDMQCLWIENKVKKIWSSLPMFKKSLYGSKAKIEEQVRIDYERERTKYIDYIKNIAKEYFTEEQLEKDRAEIYSERQKLYSYLLKCGWNIEGSKND